MRWISRLSATSSSSCWSEGWHGRADPDGACGSSDPSHAAVRTCSRLQLCLINEGPGAHIRTNMYKYRSQIDRELATIRRLKELQARFIALLGSAILAGLVGVSNLGSRVAYNALYPGSTT